MAKVMVKQEALEDFFKLIGKQLWEVQLLLQMVEIENPTQWQNDSLKYADSLLDQTRKNLLDIEYSEPETSS